MPATKTRKRQAVKRPPGRPRRVQVPTEYPKEGTASTEDAMQFLGVGRTRLYELIEAGSIKSFNEGTRRKFDWADVWEYFRARKANSVKPGQ